MKTRKNRYAPERGFSLAEMLIAITLVLLLLGALVGLYQGYGTLFAKQQSLFTLGYSANTAMTEMGQAVLEANQILASRTISGTTYSTDSDTLVLELPSVDASGMALADDVDHIVFYISGSSFYRLSEPDASSARQAGTKQLSDTLSTLALSYDMSDVTQSSKVTIDITLDTQSGHTDSQFHLRQDAYLRNRQ